jgi:hypothetical protein
MHVNESPTGNLSDSDIRGWLAGHLGGLNPVLGPPDPSTIYTLWYPDGVVADLGCDQELAYHYSFDMDAGFPITYAVVPRCHGYPADAGDLDVATASASHEWIEASTDPEPTDAPAWASTDEAHVVWDMGLFGELADMCTFDSDSYYKPAGYPYLLQRSWSNAGAMMGTPCVPVAPLYYQVLPVQKDQVAYGWYYGSGTTTGISIPLGTTKTVDLAIFSTGATGPISVDVQALSDPTTLTIVVPQPSGVNGDVLHVQVTHNSDDLSYSGAPFVIVSTLGDVQHYSYGFIGD